jgi:hypothetical protein
MMRLTYAVFQSVVEAVSGIEYPPVKLNTPVAGVYVRPVAVEESEVLEILLLNVLKSVEVR